jgi:hypothetical protein
MDSTSLRDADTLANRYLADDLTETELGAYEAYLARNPEALRELEATARLKVGLQRLRETGELPRLIAERSLFHGPLAVALAAGIAALVVGLGLWQWHPGFETGRSSMLASSLASLLDPTGHPLPAGGSQAVFRKRGEAFDAVLDLPTAAAAINIRVLPDLTGPYELSIARLRNDDSAAPMASLSKLRPAADGFVDVYVDSGRLSTGRYRLTLQNSNHESESFVVKVGVRKGP